MKKVIGVGAGGYCKLMIDNLRLMGCYTIEGLLDSNKDLWGTQVLDVPVLGGDDLLPGFYEQGIHDAFIGLGIVTDSQPRQQVYQMLRGYGFGIVDAIHPTAIISPWAKLGHGPTIMAGCIIQAAAELGENVMIDSGAIIEHDCVIQNHAHLSPGVQLAGTVIVETGAHIGIGASVRQSIRIGEHAVVGAGAVVVKDVEPWTLVVGSPARVIKQLVRQEA